MSFAEGDARRDAEGVAERLLEGDSVALAQPEDVADCDGESVLERLGALERDADLPWERMPNLGARRLTHHGDRHELGERLVLVDDDELTIPTQI